MRAASSRGPQGALWQINGVSLKLDTVLSKTDQQVLGPGGVVEETQKAVRQANAILTEVGAQLKRVDAILADAQVVAGNAKVATTDLGALRAELLRCALRTASLQFDDCPGFRRGDAGPEELAYFDYLSGRTTRTAADLCAEQGWRRPLLAWLGVEEKRAQASGDAAALERVRRRIALASGKP